MRLRLNRLRRGLGADDRGVAAIEFALVVPILILLYALGFEIAEAATVYRKLTDTTVELANVTAQYTTMAQTDVENVMNATSQIMSPYTTSSLSGTLNEVSTNSAGVATITWSTSFQNGVACQGTPLAAGTVVTPPTGFDTPNSSYIMVSTTYGYTPTVGSAFMGNINMSNEIFMLPRASSSIPYTGAACG
jgi:Flp pilus assembly protein TadG